MAKIIIPPRWVRLTALALAALLASACRSDNATAQAQGQPPLASSPAEALPEVLATVGGEPITLAQVRQRSGTDLDQLDVQYRRARDRIIENALKDLLQERVLGAEAARKGKSLDELVRAEAGGRIEPSAAEVASWFAENQARLGGRTLAELRPQIIEFLTAQRSQQARQALELRLNREHDVVVHFQPLRVALDLEGAPTLGNADAAVTVVEFSDFQCPYCRTFYPRLYQLEREFHGDVRLVFLQFPLNSIHPNAARAGQASLCAHEQGKFWALHDVLFDEQQQLSASDLKDKARRIGLDGGVFDSCLDSGRFAAKVQADLEQGLAAGVSGTPALFLNGLMLEGGALPYEGLADAVRTELSRLQR